MVTLELFQGYTDPLVNAASEHSLVLATTKNLKCLACQNEFAVDAETSFDTPIRCEACGASSEIRLLHEAWCEVRRVAFGRPVPHRADTTTARLKLVRAG